MRSAAQLDACTAYKLLSMAVGYAQVGHHVHLPRPARLADLLKPLPIEPSRRRKLRSQNRVEAQSTRVRLCSETRTCLFGVICACAGL